MVSTMAAPPFQQPQPQQQQQQHLSSSNNTDQDVLYDLIIHQVPEPKRALLSGSWSKDYLNRLTSLPATALQNEPAKLRDEQLKVERDMSELAFRDYKAFIQVKDCKSQVQETFQELGQHLQIFKDTIPEFLNSLQGFSINVVDILQKQQVFGSMLNHHSQLLEVLEIPLLMDTCVRNGYYNEALELAAHVQRLMIRYPGIRIIQEIDQKVIQGKEMMLVQLLAQLREPIKLPAALRTIGFLRRIDPFQKPVGKEEQEQQDGVGQVVPENNGRHNSSLDFGGGGSGYYSGLGNGGGGYQEEDDSALRMLFLKSRMTFMDAQLAKVVLFKGDSFGYLKKYIDATRESLFEIMTQYKSIFGEDDLYSSSFRSRGEESSLFSRSTTGTGSSTSITGADAMSEKEDYPPKPHAWSLENMLSDFVSHQIQTLVHTLQQHIPHIYDTSALSSLLTQLMYCGSSLGRVGVDIRYLVTGLFEQAVLRVVGDAFQRGTDEFLDSIGGEGRKTIEEWYLPSQWMGASRSSGGAGTSSSPGIQRAGVTSPPGSSSPLSSVASRSTSMSMSPQSILLDYPALAFLTNALLSALNSLRMLAPISLAWPLREILQDNLSRVDQALQEYDAIVFGKPSTLTTESEQQPRKALVAGLDAVIIAGEQKVADEFVNVYRRAVRDYILRCFDEGVYGGLISWAAPEDEEVKEAKEQEVSQNTMSEEPEMDTHTESQELEESKSVEAMPPPPSTTDPEDASTSPAEAAE